MFERGWELLEAFFGHEWSRPVRGTVCAGMAFGLVALLHLSGALQSLERSTLDARFGIAHRPAMADSSVVLVTIDDASISFARTRMKVGWPWPREYYGTLVDYFREGGARAVVFDVLFPEPDFARATVSARQSDERFATAMAEAGNVALAMQLTPSDSLKNALASKHSLTRSVRPGLRVPAYNGALAPIPSFQKGASAVGGVNVRADGDGVVRRVPLAYRVADSLRVPNLGIAGLQAGRGGAEEGSILSDLPVGPEGAFLLYWYGPGGVDGVFGDQYVSIRSLIVSAAQLELGQRPQVPPGRFEGKTIIVGGTAAGLYDHHSTPVGVEGTSVEREGDYPGMEIFATFLSNVRQEHYLQYVGGVWPYLLMLVMAAIGAGLIVVRPQRLGLATLAMGGTGVLYAGAAVGAFYYLLWWIPVVAPILALGMGFAATSVVSYAVEGRRRQELRSLFQRYVSPQVVDELVQDPEALELGGKEVEGTVFFSDIEGFTSVAEQLPPQAVVEELNEYFGLATDVVLDHRAMVDKFIGDAIMAIFGAPIQDPDHAAQACLAALKMNRVLADHYSATADENRAAFRSRVGIHTGQIVVGNVGTEQRVDYTAIGDAVNVAARLEQANKQYGTRVLVSEATYEQAETAIEARELDLLRVTGKDEPLRVFEVLAPVGELSDRQEELRDTFEAGLDAYRSQRWVRARRAFAEILREEPDDGPALLYQQRVEERAGETLPSNWKGVHEMSAGK
jgi:adenylate cyclase